MVVRECYPETPRCELRIPRVSTVPRPRFQNYVYLFHGGGGALSFSLRETVGFGDTRNPELAAWVVHLTKVKVAFKMAAERNAGDKFRTKAAVF